MFNSSRSSCDLPLLPREQNLESIELFKALVPDSEALTQLSATAEYLLNQAALYESVILLEARASSEIEQVVTATIAAAVRVNLIVD